MKQRMTKAAVKEEFMTLRAVIRDLFSMDRAHLETSYRKSFPSCDRPIKDLSREYMIQGLIMSAVHRATNVLDLD